MCQSNSQTPNTVPVQDIFHSSGRHSIALALEYIIQYCIDSFVASIESIIFDHIPINGEAIGSLPPAISHLSFVGIGIVQDETLEYSESSVLR